MGLFKSVESGRVGHQEVITGYFMFRFHSFNLICIQLDPWIQLDSR